MAKERFVSSLPMLATSSSKLAGKLFGNVLRCPASSYPL